MRKGRRQKAEGRREKGKQIKDGEVTLRADRAFALPIRPVVHTDSPPP